MKKKIISAVILGGLGFVGIQGILGKKAACKMCKKHKKFHGPTLPPPPDAWCSYPGCYCDWSCEC